jgi:hypothetical protein
LLVGVSAAAQEAPLLLALRDGSVVSATELRSSGGGGFTARSGGRERRLAAEDLLAVHGTAALAPELPAAELAGGTVVHGALVGGDDAGDLLDLFSPVFGRVSLPVDRLAALVQPGVHPADLRLPDGVDEAVFVRTARGIDLVAGTLHRFGSDGVRFQALVAESPQWYAPEQFLGVRLGGAQPRAEPAPANLLTRTDDRLGVALRRIDATGAEFELESGAVVTLRAADLACLTFTDAVLHLSDLAPGQVDESGFDGDVLFPWRRDRCASGGALQAMGRAYGKGLGAHSRSRLVFPVPDGVRHFWTRVAIDDSAIELPVRAHAVARVLVGSRVVFEAADLAPGQAPRDTGLIDVAPGDSIVLEVDFGRGRDLGDRVDWLMPVFLLRARRS